MNYPYAEVEFTKDGALFKPSQNDEAVSTVRDGLTTDLFGVSHGWNNDMAEARALYEALFGKISEIPGSGLMPALGARSFAVIGVFWPSKKFADAELIPGGGASTAAPENVAAVLRLLDELKNDPLTLGNITIDPARSALLDNAKALVPRLETDPSARRDFVLALRAVVDLASAHPDDGSDAFFAADPGELFTELAQPVVAPAATGGGGAAAVGGGAAGLRTCSRGSSAPPGALRTLRATTR